MEYGSTLSSEENFFYQNPKESKRFSTRRLNKEYPNKNFKKNKHWMTFYESCTQPVRSNALQEAVDQGHFELQIPLPQLNTQLNTAKVNL